MKLVSYNLPLVGLIALVRIFGVHAFSQPLNLCSVTREAMMQGMGGNNQNLGYSLIASGNIVELQAPRNPALRGFFLFATDDNGNPVGTWATSSMGFQPITSPACPNGAITHSNGNVKALSANPTFSFNLPPNVNTATVRAFAVHSRTVWQELEPISISAEEETPTRTTSKSGSRKNQSRFLLESLSVVSLAFSLYFLM